MMCCSISEAKCLISRRYHEVACTQKEVVAYSWVFDLGVFATPSKRYFCELALNWYASSVDLEALMDQGLPICGFFEMTEKDAENLIAELSSLNSGYVDNCSEEQFQKLCESLVKISPVPVNYITYEGYDSAENPHVLGKYRLDKKRIELVTQNTKYGFLFAFIHEIVHAKLDLDNRKPDFVAIEEWICNEVAVDVLSRQKIFRLRKELVGADIPLNQAIFFVECLNTQETINRFTYEEGQYYTNHGEEIEKTITLLSDSIFVELQSALKDSSETKSAVELDGRYILSPEDNKKLYEIIVNQIIPRIPCDEPEEEDY